MLDVRLTIRALVKQPIVSLTTLFALAVGIGMAATGFPLVDSGLFGRLPFANGDRFVLVDAYTDPESNRTSLGGRRFQFLAGHVTTLEHLGAFRGAAVNLQLGSGDVVPVAGAAVTPQSIGVFPYAPI